MVLRGGRIDWYYDTLRPGMAAFQVVMEEVIEELMEEAAKEVEQYAKETAPWNDRTGEARGGLTAEFIDEGNLLVIMLYHTAEHGIWLEIKNSGEYAVIIPTIEAMGPVVMGALGSSMSMAD